MRSKSIRNGQSLEIQYSSKSLTGWGGLELVARFFEAINLREVLDQALPNRRANNQVQVVDMILQFLVMVLVGGTRFEHVERVRWDEVIQRVMGIGRMGSASSLLRYLSGFWQSQSEHLHRTLNTLVFNLVLGSVKSDVIDLDSTVFERDGEQEGSSKGYNPKRPGGRSHHPLLAMFAKLKIIAHAWLRAGSASPHRGCQEFLMELFAMLPETFKIKALRADSGFYSHGLMTFLEGRNVPYVIAVKMSQPFQGWCRSLPGFVSVNKNVAITEAAYQSTKWDQPRRMVVIQKAIRRESNGMLFEVVDYDFQAFVTTLDEASVEVWQFYLRRGDCENRIKELKYSFNADSFCLQRFTGTEVAFRLVCFLFNLVSIFKVTVLEDSKPTLATVRSKVFVIGASIGRAARKDILRLGLVNPWRHEFEKLLARLRAWSQSTAAHLTKFLENQLLEQPTPWTLRNTGRLLLAPN